MAAAHARRPDCDEAAVRRAWQKGDANGAITAALEQYGPEILGWLVGVLRDADAANDVFSAFAERLWSTFASFGWRCSVRTWAYAIARRAAVDHQRGETRPRGPNCDLGKDRAIQQLCLEALGECLANRETRSTELARDRDYRH